MTHSVLRRCMSGLLAVLEQHPDTDWRVLVDAVQVEADTGGVKEQAMEADDLASFDGVVQTFRLAH